MQKKKTGEKWKQKKCFLIPKPSRLIKLSLLGFYFYCSPSFSQSKIIKIYFDKEEKKIKEIYQINDNKELNGKYISYFEKGGIKSKGSYLNNQPDGYWEYFYENGKLKTAGNLIQNQPVGKWNYYYENGKPRSEGELENNLKNGIWLYYYENEKLKAKGNWKNDKKNGPWFYYYEDQRLKAKGFFENGIGSYTEFYPSGKIKCEGTIAFEKSDSIWIYYYENGAIESKGKEKEGLKEGYWEFFYSNGKLASKGFFIKGKEEGQWDYFYPSGQLYTKGLNKNGLQDSTWKAYYDTGILLSESDLNKGSGSYKEYHLNGKIKIEGYLKNGKHEGQWNYYNEKGILEGQAHFSNGEGTYIGFYENGKIKMEGPMKNGKRTGSWKLYKSSGELAGFYKNYYTDSDQPYHIHIAQQKDSSALTIEKNQYTQSKKKNNVISISKRTAYHGIIVSTSPISPLAYSLPIGIEKFNYRSKTGIEITYFVHRKSFFQSTEAIEPYTLYERGGSLSAKLKFYKEEKNIGMLYWANEIRGKYIRYLTKITNPNTTIYMEEKSIEYATMIGYRLMQSYKKRGFTIDTYVGAGVGYRWLTKKFPEKPEYDNIFKDISTNKIALSFRIGLQLGYVF